MPVRTSDVERLADLLNNLAVQEGTQPSAINGVHLVRHSKPQAREPYVYEPSIIFVAQGRKIGYLGEDVYTYDARNYLVLSVPLPLECEVIASPKKPLLAVTLQVNPTALAELLVEMDEGIPVSAEMPRAMYSAPLTQELRASVIRLLECLQSPLDGRVLGPSVVREIIYRVLCGERGGALRALAARHSQFGQISRVLRRIHAEYPQAFDVETMAHEANMGLTTFHHKFKSVTSVSPLQYLKSIRLHKARLLIAHDGMNANTAATKVGYESPSQFSREFKRLFGKSPLEEAERLKAIMERDNVHHSVHPASALSRSQPG